MSPTRQFLCFLDPLTFYICVHSVIFYNTFRNKFRAHAKHKRNVGLFRVAKLEFLFFRIIANWRKYLAWRLASSAKRISEKNNRIGEHNFKRVNKMIPKTRRKDASCIRKQKLRVLVLYTCYRVSALSVCYIYRAIVPRLFLHGHLMLVISTRFFLHSSLTPQTNAHSDILRSS